MERCFYAWLNVKNIHSNLSDSNNNIIFTAIWQNSNVEVEKKAEVLIDNFKTYSSLRISSINILNTTYIFYSILQTFNHDNIQGFLLNGNLNNILSSTYINMIKLGNRHATYLSPVTISYDTVSNNDIKLH